jgi:hypothetical protein
MAGFFPLNRAQTHIWTLALASLLAPTLSASAADTNAAPVKPAAPAPVAKNAVPPPQEDYFQRYGKILAPGTEPAHPLKLNMPFPDVGQISIPSQEQLDMREKLEHLATMSDADILQDLEKWPAFSKMSLADEGNMMVRIQQFKDRRAKLAQARAHALGLLTLKPDQLEKFEKEYWDKRMQMDRELAKQFAPIFNAREAQIEEQLYREFSTPGHDVPLPPAPKPPALPKVAQNSKPPAP